MPVRQRGTPAQRTSSLASRRILEKVNGSAVQFGENILKTRGASAESCIGRLSAFVRLDQPSDAVRLPNSRPWRATLASDTPIHSKNCCASDVVPRGTRRRPSEFGSRIAGKAQAGTTGRNRTRTMAMNDRPADFADLAAIASAIERSQIVFRRSLARRALRFARRLELPAGFEDIDVAILEWIAAESRRARCDYPPL